MLELEASVQRNPNDAQAWYELGVKQQENEREQQALAALQRAVELDPSHLPTWLALGVSYTNDGYRGGTYQAVKEWVMRNEKHKAVVQNYSQQLSAVEDSHIHEKMHCLVQCLIAMAQSGSEEELDADIQIALGVLFYTEEVRQSFITSVTPSLSDSLGLRQSTGLFPRSPFCQT